MCIHACTVSRVRTFFREVRVSTGLKCNTKGEIIYRVSSKTIITRFIELDLRLSDEKGKLSDEKLNLPDILSDELTKDILRPELCNDTSPESRQYTLDKIIMTTM